MTRDAIQDVINEANILRNGGENEKAIDLLQEFKKKNPHCPTAAVDSIITEIREQMLTSLPKPRATAAEIELRRDWLTINSLLNPKLLTMLAEIKHKEFSRDFKSIVIGDLKRWLEDAVANIPQPEPGQHANNQRYGKIIPAIREIPWLTDILQPETGRLHQALEKFECDQAELLFQKALRKGDVKLARDLFKKIENACKEFINLTSLTKQLQSLEIIMDDLKELEK